MRVWDDDPDYGPARWIEVTVLDINKVISLTGDIVQRVNPLSAMRAVSAPDDALAPHRPCRTVGCTNKASTNHSDCSTCRSKRLARCVCGRRRSHGAVRCI